MKQLKTLNVVTPLIMTISLLIVIAIYMFGEGELVSWLTVFFAWAAVIFSWLLYDAYKQLVVVSELAGLNLKQSFKIRSKIESLIKSLEDHNNRNDEIIKMMRNDN